MRTIHPTGLIVVLLLSAAAGPAAAQTFCDDPPSLTVLTGVDVAVSGLASEGHPVSYSWFITPPGASVPTKPTSTAAVHTFSPTLPGLWSVALVTNYEHGAIGGGLWSSDDCITVQAASVVAAIGLSGTQVATDEELFLNGFSSQWAAGVAPQVEWRIDGQAFGACNGGPPPSSSNDLSCTVPGNWLAPGWHTAGLLLTDPSSGDSSLDTADFEVIEIVPLSVDFGWTPADPQPGSTTHFVAELTPLIPEGDLTHVVWDMDDGTVVEYTSCPPVYGSCLEWPHIFATDGWYDVSLTVETIDETASKTYRVKIGDPVEPPNASFESNPLSPQIHQITNLTFNGDCTGQCQWAWDFGDGAQSTQENPTHVWFVPETYTVSLTVSNEGGNDVTTVPVDVTSCWSPTTPTQQGTCYGGPVILTAAAGNGWMWNTGGSGQVIPATFPGSYWVNVDDGAGCWGHAPATVVLNNCGDPGGDANLDGTVDGADLAALIPELTDGDGDSVVGAGGGDLTAPGGDVNGDFLLRTDDQLTVLVTIFE